MSTTTVKTITLEQALTRSAGRTFDQPVPTVAMRDSTGNLPSELTSFVGRRKELGEAKALLSTARLLTITGTGGVGKSRLARRLLADVHRAFPQGVWQVELAELTEPALVAATVATSLGLHEAETLGALQERLAGRQLLLLLDNCEHLIDACAVTADALLRTCPLLQIVATSRQPLAIDGEQSLSLSPLSAPDPEQHADLAHPELFDATRLFVERAGAVQPGFAVDRDNKRAVAELVHRLDGIPLALEFAALRVRALTPDEIVARLDQLSVGGSRSAPSRQQTLRTLVDWSYQLCSEPERELWCRLSVCAGGFDLATAEGICKQDLVDLVVSLVDKSVLVREERGGRVQYRMLQTIRAYGREQLAASGMEAHALRDHRDWFVQLATRAHDAYAGPDQLAWFTRLRQQHPDLRAAIEHALEADDGPEPALRIVLSLLDHWLAFGFLTEGRYWLERVLRTTVDPLLRAGALRGSALFAAFQGDTGATSMDEAIALAAGDVHELTWCTYTAGAVAMLAGDFPKARDLFDQAVVGMAELGDQHGLLNSLTCHALIASFTEDLERAESAVAAFLAIADPLGEQWARAHVLWALGVATWRAGDLPRAAALELEALGIRLAFDDHVGLIWSTEVLAWIAAAEGKHESAAVLLGASGQAADLIGSPVASIAFLVENHETCSAQVQQALGRARFEEAFRRGQALRPAEVLDLATGSRPKTSAPTTGNSPLTRREREIAELVAEGLSNKEIAARLVIALRTAEGHVEHVLVKLGFTSRGQIAAWVRETR